jgi:hypothetical protein
LRKNYKVHSAVAIAWASISWKVDLMNKCVKELWKIAKLFLQLVVQQKALVRTNALCIYNDEMNKSDYNNPIITNNNLKIIKKGEFK